MNIKKIITVGLIAAASGAMALDYVEVTDVKARQRYPWNGKVDIDFQLDSRATEPYQMIVEVFDNVGKTNLPVQSVSAEGVSFEENPCMVRTDTTRIVWDAGKDLPNGFTCTNVLVTCRDDRLIAESNRYMIVELSSGAISYTNCPPSGGWTEDYMTTKMALRRIRPQAFYMGSPVTDVEHASNEVLHKVKITKPYYIGVFEVTEKQYALICGGSGDGTRPVEKTWGEIRGEDVANGDELSFDKKNFVVNITQKNTETQFSWPKNTEVDDNSFMGKLRDRTGLQVDLPTEAQWECACKAGCSAPLYIGTSNSPANESAVVGAPKLDKDGLKYTYVGVSVANAFGIFDMCGTVAEWCLDRYQDNLSEFEQIDPIGAAFSTEEHGLSSSITMHRDYYSNGSMSDKFQYKGTWYSVWDSGASGNYEYSFKYHAFGCRRVVKGGSCRAASRSSELNLPITRYFTEGVSIFRSSRYIAPGVEEVWNKSETIKASWGNARHGIRVCVLAE